MINSKTCGRCQKTKDTNEFAFRNKAKSTRQAWCKKCHKQIDKERYYNGPRKQQVLKLNRKYRGERKHKIDTYKLERGCTRCGYNRHPAALDFHHIRDKEQTITKLVRSLRSWDKVQEEIRKCIILCANCHRIEHSGVVD